MFGNNILVVGGGISLEGDCGRFRTTGFHPLLQASRATADQFRSLLGKYDCESNIFKIPTGMIMGMTNILSIFGAYISAE